MFPELNTFLPLLVAFFFWICRSLEGAFFSGSAAVCRLRARVGNSVFFWIFRSPQCTWFCRRSDRRRLDRRRDSTADPTRPRRSEVCAGRRRGRRRGEQQILPRLGLEERNRAAAPPATRCRVSRARSGRGMARNNAIRGGGRKRRGAALGGRQGRGGRRRRRQLRGDDGDSFAVRPSGGGSRKRSEGLVLLRRRDGGRRQRRRQEGPATSTARIVVVIRRQILLVVRE